ncbi:MAG: metal ABC transporter permease [Rhodospirillales bacterium]|nr:metal ABC transporter permease [Rhodospirillales bacterium]
MPLDGGLPDFLLRALLAGIGVAILAGPLGCIVVWRRMAYFGEAMAHASLLGVVLGAVLGVFPWAIVITVCIGAALLLYVLERHGKATLDSAIGLVAHGSLALGLVVLSFAETVQVNLLAYLFGDILSVSQGDLWLILGGGLVVLCILAVIWSPLLSVVVNPDVAQVEGVNVAMVKVIYLVLLALTVAAAMKIVGVLLVVAMLVIPASAARALSTSPEGMALNATLVGIAGVCSGLWGAYQFDTPAGPSIVTAVVCLFAVFTCLGSIVGRASRR